MIRPSKKEIVVSSFAILSCLGFILSGLFYMADFPYSHLLALIIFPISAVSFGISLLLFIRTSLKR